MILPSFLEYSVQSLEKKLELILANPDKFQKLVNSENKNSTNNQTSNLQKSSQKDQQTQKKLEVSQKKNTHNSIDFKSQQNLQNSPIWHFHLDFVLSQFAKDRSVMKSLGLTTVFGILKEKLFEQNLALTVHLMGEMEDWAECFDFLKNFLAPQNWQIELFVPTKITNWFSFEQANLTTLTWFDLGFWQKENFEKELIEKEKTKTWQKKILAKENPQTTIKKNSPKNSEYKSPKTTKFITKSFSKNSSKITRICWHKIKKQNSENALKINDENKVWAKCVQNLEKVETPSLSPQNKKNKIATPKVKEIENRNQNPNFQSLQKTPKILLMTVKAGSSGQKMTLETKNQVLEIIQKNPKINFILDGGWQLSDLEISPKNADLVSYSSFWQNFE